jgi:hypothetical protein
MASQSILGDKVEFSTVRPAIIHHGTGMDVAILPTPLVRSTAPRNIAETLHLDGGMGLVGLPPRVDSDMMTNLVPLMNLHCPYYVDTFSPFRPGHQSIGGFYMNVEQLPSRWESRMNAHSLHHLPNVQLHFGLGLRPTQFECKRE